MKDLFPFSQPPSDPCTDARVSTHITQLYDGKGQTTRSRSPSADKKNDGPPLNMHTVVVLSRTHTTE